MYFFNVQKGNRRFIFNGLVGIGLMALCTLSWAVTPDLAHHGVETLAEGNKDSVSVHDLNKVAFGSMTQAMLPMSPEQIKRLRALFNQTQAAAATTPGTPPRPTISSQFVQLEPGATPTVIRLAEGYVTTLAFLDSTGQPWPVENYDIGNPQAFNIQWDKKSNLLMIQATSLYNVGNLAVQLRHLETPVMVTLISGQKAVDYRVDLRIPGNGPHAKALLGRNLPQRANPVLLNVLEGVPPPKNVALKVSGGLAQAWLMDNHLYLRTRLTLISPAWIASMSSPDGMKAYEMPKTPLILGFEDGQSIQLKIEGF
ncbi:DotH/IcmK family type IV secretion protein [Rickettsiella grylli]|uniref:IcmK protein n=1 Tax=Rickettsiella grylli TaxID=59196 RepID=A8PMY6_9COXI|nr:DotH/IcmK family type IV secretion protein [Rickettsiella grylli]EDP46565.1 IcmK protein [Rickettsiella grylli]